MNEVQELKDRSDHFFNNYLPIKYSIPDGTKIIRLTQESNKCRFCGEQVPTVTFKNDSHTFPQLIGNHSLLSKFECDECNSIFSEFENHLGNFLKDQRTLNQIRGKRGIPSYKDTSINARIDVKENKIFIQNQIGKEIIKLDEDKKEFTISLKRSSYIPNLVYKCFIKMAISMLPEEDLVHFTRIKKWLRSKSNNALMMPQILMMVHMPDISINGINAIIFKKKSDNPEIPHYQFVIAFKSYQYQIFIPSDLDFDLNSESKNLTICKFPTPAEIQNVKANVYYFTKDLTSTEFERGGNNDYTFTYEKKIETKPDTN